MGGGFQRDEATGKMLVDDDGYPLLNNSVELGYVTPDWTGGVASGFYYKSFSLNFSLDFQKGGKFVSISKMFMSGSGLSAETAGLNDKGNPKRNAVDDGGGVKLDAINASSGKPNEVYADTKELYQSYSVLPLGKLDIRRFLRETARTGRGIFFPDPYADQYAFQRH